MTRLVKRLRTIGGAVRIGIIITGGVAVTTVGVVTTVVAGGGGGGGSFPEGTFDCYGTTGCSSLPTARTCTSTISSGLQTALNSASGGNVICLNTGTYAGNVTLTSKSYASDVTVQPAPNATVTTGGYVLNAVAHLHITGNGGGSATMSMGGDAIDQSSGCSTNLTFDYVTFTGASDAQPQFACSHGLNWLWDHDRFDNLGDGMREGRVNFVGPGTSVLADGATVSNSHFGGYGTGGTNVADCSDGVEFEGVYGTVIGPGNEFTGIDQAGGDNCGTGVHVDPIAGFNDDHTTITGNYFHDNGSGSGGILSAGEINMTVTNNVFASTGYANSIVDKAPLTGENITHNVFFRAVETETGNGPGFATNGSGNLIRNNTFPPGGSINMPNGTSVTFTADHNAGLDIAGTPVFVTSPASGYYHYVLAPGSPGYHAGSDGLSTGLNP